MTRDIFRALIDYSRRYKLPIRGLRFKVFDSLSSEHVKGLDDAMEDLWAYQMQRSKRRCDPVWRIRKDHKQSGLWHVVDRGNLGFGDIAIFWR